MAVQHVTYARQRHATVRRRSRFPGWMLRRFSVVTFAIVSLGAMLCDLALNEPAAAELGLDLAMGSCAIYILLYAVIHWRP